MSAQQCFMSRNGWNQTELGDVLDLSQPRVSARLRGVTPWSTCDIQKLADAAVIAIAITGVDLEGESSC